MTCEEVILKWDNLCRSEANKFSYKHEFDDLYQEARIALFKAFEIYSNPEVGFGYFARIFVKNAMRNYNRDNSDKLDVISYNTIFNEYDDNKNFENIERFYSEKNTENEAINILALNQVISRVKNMSERRREIFIKRFVEDKVQRQIGLEVGISQKSVYQNIKQIKNDISDIKDSIAI